MNDEDENLVQRRKNAQRSSADAFLLNRHPPAERGQGARFTRPQVPSVTIEDEEDKPVRIGRDK